MGTTNPLGLHIQNIEYPGPQWVIDHCRAAQYTTVTMLDDHRLAGRIQAEAGVPYTVARLSKFEPYPGAGANQKQIDDYSAEIYKSVKNVTREANNPNLHVMINCEQGFPDRPRVLMYCALMRIAAADPEGPVGMVFMNVGSGIMRSGFWGQPNDWAQDHFMVYLLTLDLFRNVRLKSGSYAFIHGSHPYTSQYPWIAVNAGLHRVPSWEEGNKFTTGQAHIDWNLAQDHLGREYQGIRRALGYKWDNAKRLWNPTADTPRNDTGYVQPPWIINTENFLDDMADVRNVHPDTRWDRNPFAKGLHACKTQWETKWFKGDTFDTTAARMYQWVWDVIDGPTGYVLGSHYFCVGDTGPWDLDNLTPGGNTEICKNFFDVNVGVRRTLPKHFFAAQVGQPPQQPPPVEPPPYNPPQQPPSGLTAAENEILKRLAGALEAFTVLPEKSAAEYNGFAISIQQAMNVILARPTIRAMQKANLGGLKNQSENS